MTEMTPCREYDAENHRCKSGFFPLHYACWGAVSHLPKPCVNCGHVPKSALPPCMRDDIGPHLLRDDGLPLGWPDGDDND